MKAAFVDIEHTHCPCGCEHPQPIEIPNVPEAEELAGKAICGRCWFDDRSKCVMVPCTPDICDDE